MTEVLTYEALKAERDALAVERDAARNALASIYKTVTGELPEWSNWHAYLEDIVEEVGAAIAANQTADALAVENAAMRDALDSIRIYSSDTLSGPSDSVPDMAAWLRDGVEHLHQVSTIETPATDAALAAIQAQRVEKFADFLDSPIDGRHCYQHEVGLARHFASTLREAK